MDLVLQLEAFDADDPKDASASAAYQTGFAAGLEAGTAAAHDATDQLHIALLQSLTQISCSYAQARQEVLSSFATLVTGLTESLLPHCVAQGFAAQVADLVLRAAATGPDQPISIHVHPDQVSKLQAFIDGTAVSAIVTADPTLSPQAAWIGQAGAETCLDMDRHLAEVTQILANFNPKG